MNGWEARLPEPRVGRRRPSCDPLLCGSEAVGAPLAGAGPVTGARAVRRGRSGRRVRRPPAPPTRRRAALRTRDLGLSTELPEAAWGTRALDAETPLGLLSFATFPLRLSADPFARCFLGVRVAVLLTYFLNFPAGPGEAEARTCGGLVLQPGSVCSRSGRSVGAGGVRDRVCHGAAGAEPAAPAAAAAAAARGRGGRRRGRREAQ